MRAFIRGFLEGIKSTAMIIGGMSAFMGIMYCITIGSKYLIDTLGSASAIVLLMIILIICAGIVQGLWVRYQYNKLAIRLQEIEQKKDTMTAFAYEQETNKVKSAMNSVLHGDYSRIVR